jgi:hemerythrin
MSLAWTGFHDEYSPIVLSSHLAEVNSLEQIKEFLLNETEYHFNANVAFMTRDGHIGYQQLGRYPIRANP